MTVGEPYISRFKRAVNDYSDPPKFSPDEVQDYFAQAQEAYPSASWAAWTAYAVVAGLNDLITQYAEQVTYTANASSESLSDIARRYEGLRDNWQEKLDKALVSTESGVMWGNTRVFPSRDEEYPDA